MILCRFTHDDNAVRVGLVEDASQVIDITSADAPTLHAVLESDDPAALVGRMRSQAGEARPLADVRILSPVDRQEIWAAGVTYLRSKAARMEESDFSASAYDRVYDAARPEIFFKSVAEKVVPSGGAVGIRTDARWNVPEPELALVLNSKGRIVGHTIGNDMSARDIEGENLLYLPQAKIYTASCSIGPWIRLGAAEETARGWTIRMTIARKQGPVFTGETSVGQIKRPFAELADYLFRSQAFPHGVILLTGTGIVPPDSFTLQPDDAIKIEIPPIGVLRNHVVTV